MIGAATDKRKRSRALPLFCMSFQASNSTCLCLFLLATISSMCFTLRSSLLHFWSHSSEGFKLRPHFYQNAVHAAKQEFARKKRSQGSIRTVGKEGGNQKPELQVGKIQALAARLSSPQEPFSAPLNAKQAWRCQGWHRAQPSASAQWGRLLSVKDRIAMPRESTGKSGQKQ